MELNDVLLQYGALGVLALLCVGAVRVMYNRLQKAYDDERARADRLEGELRQLNEIMRTDYVTVLGKASQAIIDANRAVGDALSAVRRGS
jgi:hypothetical protein